jgi:hypothetical protein
MRYRFFALVLIALAACDSSTSEVSESILRNFQSSGRTFVNLTEAVPGPWEKVCILGPYSDNKATQTTLGFDWNAEANTSILSNQGISLLLFVQGTEIVKSVEYLRRNGDFTNLSRQCFQREQAFFAHHPNPKKGWPGLFPKE